MPAKYIASGGASSFPMLQTSAQTDQLGINVAPGVGTLTMETSAHTRYGYLNHTHIQQTDRDYTGGDTVRITKGGYRTSVDVDNNDPTYTPTDIIGTSYHSVMTSGVGGPSYGTLINYIAQLNVKQVPSIHSNEYSIFFGSMVAGTYDAPISGGNYWHHDEALHGPIGQPGILSGFSLVTNNYFNGSPAGGTAVGMCLQTCPKIGAGFNSMCQGEVKTGVSATTYPWDVGYFISGYATGGTGDGYTNAIQVGGLPGPWMGTGRTDYGGDYGQVARGIAFKARRDGVTPVTRLGAVVSEGLGERGGLVFGLDTSDSNRATVYRSANSTLSIVGQIIPTSLVSAANDSAAATSGVPVGGLYQTSGTLKARQS